MSHYAPRLHGHTFAEDMTCLFCGVPHAERYTTPCTSALASRSKGAAARNLTLRRCREERASALALDAVRELEGEYERRLAREDDHR